MHLCVLVRVPECLSVCQHAFVCLFFVVVDGVCMIYIYIHTYVVIHTYMCVYKYVRTHVRR